MSKDNADQLQQRNETDYSEIETDDVNGVAPRGAQAPPTSPRRRAEEGGFERRQRLTDEEILRLLPASQSTNQDAVRLLQCKAKDCARVATKECAGYCPNHFCELYKRGEIDIPEPGSLEQTTARGYNASSDEPGLSPRESRLSVQRHTSSGSGGNSPSSGSCGNSPRMPHMDRTPSKELRRRRTTARPGGSSGSSGEGNRQVPVECLGPLCKTTVYSGNLCRVCEEILKKAKPLKTAKSYPCAFSKCKKRSYEKGNLCRDCQKRLGDARAREISAPTPDEVVPGRRLQNSSPPLARHLVHSETERYHGARPRSTTRQQPRPTYQEPQPRNRNEDDYGMARRHVPERDSRRRPTGDNEPRRQGYQARAHERHHYQTQRSDERQDERAYHHTHRRHETEFERHQRSDRYRKKHGGHYDARHADRLHRQPDVAAKAEYFPSEFETESPPSSLISEANPCSIQDESHQSGLSISKDDHDCFNRKYPKGGNYGNGSIRSRNESGNEFSSVTDIPARHPCKSRGCENYGNKKCDGFCNSCFSKLRW